MMPRGVMPSGVMPGRVMPGGAMGVSVVRVWPCNKETNG
jgi:hypothetical protein